MHRVQVGAFANKANADAMLDRLHKMGYKDAFITTNGAVAPKTPATPAPATPPPNWTEEVNRIAREIWNAPNAGGWGNGSTRVQRVSAHGTKLFGAGKGAQFARDVQARVDATAPKRG